MRAEQEITGGRIRIRLRLDPEEVLPAVGQQGMQIELLTDTATIVLPETRSQPHPDLLALATLTIARPWCRSRLVSSSGVSASFAEAAERFLQLDVGPVDPGLERRSPGTRPGLMYSGGPDCMAAELLLGGSPMPLLHFERVPHPRVPDRMTHVKNRVQREFVQQAAARGEEVHIAQSDLEYLCRPFATFPHWAAVTVGAVLQADALDLGGIVTGRNISGIYLGWGSGFTPGGEQEMQWEGMFDAAGIPLIQPLAGTSDVVSKRIAKQHRLFDLARSCLLGSATAPCSQCAKCMANDLIQAASERTPLPPGWSDSYVRNQALAARMQRRPPYPNQQLLEYAFTRIPDLDATFLAAANQYLSGHIDDPEHTAWVDAYYRPGLEHVPSDLAAKVSRFVAEHIGFMSQREEQHVESWAPSAAP